MTNEIPYEIPPELERFIHKLHLRTFDKIMPHVKEQFPDVTPQQVKHIMNENLKNIFLFFIFLFFTKWKALKN